ncbi:MAG: hypothetical protein A2X17_08200 [Bacteroidetes bacterium GWF2_41_61]|jgi:hypothetical protein|nr:MAG: hypothetical protein A2X20_12160 [Bacteroidetes bacterium GWE2_40_15]OFY34729.1 MAG: hypothetical protein A2X17_08200 [Bacteroidetes bacterium GWF2_41_61]OFY91510.1 MAG: hypothetical protein A2266_05925 [Bacteroidetes bacterium RIFOXYA12_FULL_40_10]PKP06966.1 MAG: hypothetical protein CVU10_05245 [Bacteroidetes bacterium HGW-Bacteroidetes-5]HBG24269.1 hypothetical protein [Rikenellaceae bacterium]
MKKVTFLSALVLMIVLATGCAKLPQAELDAATAALDSAKVVEANRYLADEFNALQDSLNSANVEIEAQKSKLFISRNYKAITEKLVNITTSVEGLKVRAEERKIQVRTEVQDTLVVLNELILEDKALLAKAPKGKEGKAALEAIMNDITVLEASVAEINTLITNGDYLTAQDKTNASKAKAEAIKEELTAAIGKTKRR